MSKENTHMLLSCLYIEAASLPDACCALVAVTSASAAAKPCLGALWCLPGWKHCVYCLPGSTCLRALCFVGCSSSRALLAPSGVSLVGLCCAWQLSQYPEGACPCSVCCSRRLWAARGSGSSARGSAELSALWESCSVREGRAEGEKGGNLGASER